MSVQRQEIRCGRDRSSNNFHVLLMETLLLAEEDCSIKRGQPSITRDLPKSSSFLAEVFLTIYHYCYGVAGNVSK